MIGNKVSFFQSLVSTNGYMKDHISSFSDGDIICAKVQTAGKGRRSNIWMSNNGDLHLSLYLDNSNKKHSLFDVVLLITNSLVKVLNKFNVDAKIKYPNDIVVGYKKIAGILVKHIIGDKESFIIGIGLNVVTEDFSRIDRKGTSILLETNQKFDYRDVLQEFISSFNELEECKSCDLYNMYLEDSVVIGRSIVIENESYLVKTINLEGKVVLVKDDVEYAKHMNEISFKEYYDEFKD